MDLQNLQYQMWLAVRRHQALIGKRQEDPHNLAVQKEILDVLCQLVSINENQKLVVARLREERHQCQVKQEKENGIHSDDGKDEIDLLYDDEMVNDTLQEKDSKAAPVPHTLERTSGQPPKSLRDQEALSDNTHRHPAASDPLKDHHQQTGIPEAPASPPVWWCSPEKRLHNFQPPTADYSQEDIHDLVTEDEFMHALGLLTVKECEEVLAKRYERRKHTAYSHIFSATIWEKPETRRKRRAWLTSGAGSPPMLRRKVRPPSQPPSQPQSRPASPTQSSCSPMTTCPLSQPASPQSLEEEETPASQPSEEICPMCKVKGADVQCDGCGVIYHAQCVDLEDSEPPPCWLCLTCEQLGLRASSSHTDPHHLSRRRV
ncbi:uncharacterized protein LOC127009015 isoform X3 [Eriocheir sinensis]|uniref:uncharacterized protein LOC127009015 isoform X3 n=1 Tax=Eriocheir sinensis TaxID=95602 RepID=UPI0021C7A3BC|nr:uncharacterized protein LOC127009015 isoform X3 [Eriocheir sinensis]